MVLRTYFLALCSGVPPESGQRIFRNSGDGAWASQLLIRCSVSQTTGNLLSNLKFCFVGKGDTLLRCEHFEIRSHTLWSYLKHNSLCSVQKKPVKINLGIVLKNLVMEKDIAIS